MDRGEGACGPVKNKTEQERLFQKRTFLKQSGNS
jgi:hypothetical protein